MFLRELEEGKGKGRGRGGEGEEGSRVFIYLEIVFGLNIGRSK